jgi:hypothetical protein
MKIDNTKLAALHDYLVNGGSPEQEDVAKQIGEDVDDEAAVEAYVEALKAKWPKVYGKPAAPAPAPKAVKQAEPAPATYRLRKPDGTVAALEVVASKNGTVVLQEPVPTDKVTVLVKGKPVTVDLIELAKYPTDSPHGIPNSKLIELAELAKA